jgi:bifunctional DNase/RNase
VVELENDLENVEDEDEAKQKEDKDKRDKNHTIIKRNQNSVKVKVNINVTSLDKKKKKQKKKADPPIPKEKKVSYELLDTLFSFIGVSMNKEQVKSSQDRLNLFTSRSHMSRSTAGTIDLMPGSTNPVFD